VASGDVTISGNLLVDGGGGTDRSSLPSVGIIAGGNIYIKSAATQVDAMLVSNDGIYTCDGPGIPVFPNCDNTLTVNGFLMGRNLFLGRLGS
jgi:hypothetical protein